MPMKIADQWNEYNPSEDYSKQTKETLEQLFSFPDSKDVNLDNFIDKTSPKLRLELVKLENLNIKLEMRQTFISEEYLGLCKKNIKKHIALH